MGALLEDIEVETSSKHEVFDVLDVDMSGHLTVEELVHGLMTLRGPVSKVDIVAVRLKVRYITSLIELQGADEETSTNADLVAPTGREKSKMCLESMSLSAGESSKS